MCAVDHGKPRVQLLKMIACAGGCGVEPLVHRLLKLALGFMQPAPHGVDARVNLSQALDRGGIRRCRARAHQENKKNDECPGREAGQQTNDDERCLGHMTLVA